MRISYLLLLVALALAQFFACSKKFESLQEWQNYIALSQNEFNQEIISKHRVYQAFFKPLFMLYSNECKSDSCELSYSEFLQQSEGYVQVDFKILDLESQKNFSTDLFKIISEKDFFILADQDTIKCSLFHKEYPLSTNTINISLGFETTANLASSNIQFGYMPANLSEDVLFTINTQSLNELPSIRNLES